MAEEEKPDMKNELSKKREKFWKNMRGDVDQKFAGREGGRKFLHGVFDFLQGWEKFSEETGEPQVKALEKQIADIMGPWASHLSNRDKAELIVMSFEERTEKLIEHRKRYEKLGLPGGTEDKAGQLPGDLETELVLKARQAINDVDSLIKFKNKIFADLEWEYRDDPEKLEEMKKIYDQIFLKIRHEHGW